MQVMTKRISMRSGNGEASAGGKTMSSQYWQKVWKITYKFVCSLVVLFCMWKNDAKNEYAVGNWDYWAGRWSGETHCQSLRQTVTISMFMWRINHSFKKLRKKGWGIKSKMGSWHAHNQLLKDPSRRILMLVYKSLKGLAQKYIEGLLLYQQLCRPLRSSGSCPLCINRVRSNIHFSAPLISIKLLENCKNPETPIFF